MRRFVPALAALLLLHACKKEFSAVVVSVTDGDTIIVEDKGGRETIRLFGIDCPESIQAFGEQAKEFTSRLALSRTVRVYPLYKDPHGRVVAKVYLTDGKYLNGE